MDDGADEERGIRDPAGHHHGRPGGERRRHGVRAEIGIRGRHAGQDALQRHAGLHQGLVRAGGDGIPHVVAQQHRAAPVFEPEVGRDLGRLAARRERVGGAHVAEHPHASRRSRRQHSAHAVFQLGGVAAPLAAPHGEGLARDGALGQAFEGDVVEAAAFDQLHRRLPAIAGEARAGADAHALPRHRPLPALHGGSSAQEAAAPLPRAAWIFRQIEFGRSGSSVISISKGLSASQMALQIVPGTSDGRPSPMPRLPSGV